MVERGGTRTGGSGGNGTSRRGAAAAAGAVAVAVAVVRAINRKQAVLLGLMQEAGYSCSSDNGNEGDAQARAGQCVESGFRHDRFLLVCVSCLQCDGAWPCLELRKKLKAEFGAESHICRQACTRRRIVRTFFPSFGRMGSEGVGQV